MRRRWKSASAFCHGAWRILSFMRIAPAFAAGRASTSRPWPTAHAPWKSTPLAPRRMECAAWFISSSKTTRKRALTSRKPGSWAIISSGSARRIARSLRVESLLNQNETKNPEAYRQQNANDREDEAGSSHAFTLECAPPPSCEHNAQNSNCESVKRDKPDNQANDAQSQTRNRLTRP